MRRFFNSFLPAFIGYLVSLLKKAASQLDTLMNPNFARVSQASFLLFATKGDSQCISKQTFARLIGLYVLQLE